MTDEPSLEGANPPEGFAPSTGRGPFTTHNGPYFHKIEEDGTLVQGFRATHRHCNGHGIVHGGMLMAFADGVLASASWRETRRRCVTIRMTSDFVHMVRSGEWVEGRARVTRAAKTVCFVEGEVTVGKNDVLKVSGIFKLFRK